MLQNGYLVSKYKFIAQASDDGSKVDCVLKHFQLPPDGLKVSEILNGNSLAYEITTTQ